MCCGNVLLTIAPSCLTLQPHGLWPSRLLCPGDRPEPGIEPRSPASPVLADGFFATSTTWETCGNVDIYFLSDGQADPWKSLKSVDSSGKGCICERQKVEGLAILTSTVWCNELVLSSGSQV